MPKADIDFDDTSVFKQAAGKKGKKSAAAASKSKWADEGDEGGSKDGGEGGDENGGGVGGSNNGDGGAGGDGDGGGGGDWGGWDTGKKKKGKKGRKEQEEEEKNKKEEEEAANGGIKLDWADEANGDAGDDWGEFTNTTKKKDKKDKKGKVLAHSPPKTGRSLYEVRSRISLAARVISTTLAWMIRRKSNSALAVPKTRKTPDLVAISVAGTLVIGALETIGAFLGLMLEPPISRIRFLSPPKILQIQQQLTAAYGILEVTRRGTRKRQPPLALTSVIWEASTRIKRKKRRRKNPKLMIGVQAPSHSERKIKSPRKRVLGMIHLLILIRIPLAPHSQILSL